MLPKVSFIIPCYKQDQLMREAILSCLNQEVKLFEIIVVDDGSPDNTSTIAKEYPVKLIQQENKGLPAARNAGIKEARGEWIVCLDADDKVREDFIGKFLNVDGDIISVGVQEFGDCNRNWSTKIKNPTYYDMILNGNLLICSSPFKKKVWETIRGFDENMRDGYEDYDFWLRALKAGFKITSIPDQIFLYRRHGQTMSQQSVQKHDKLMDYILSK